MSVKYSIDAKVYHAASIADSPAWSEINIVKDVTLTLEKSEFDVTTRANGGWKAVAAAMKDATIEFDMPWDPSNSAFQALKDAFFGNTAIGIACMDGPVATAGSEGLWADCAVLTFTREEPLEEGLTAKVKLKPTYSANAPVWKEVAGS